MGSSQSKKKQTRDNRLTKNYYSDKDIEKNIKRFFSNKSNYHPHETSDETLGFNNNGGFLTELDDQSYINTVTSDVSLNMRPVYQSHRNRYEKYDVRNNILPKIQDGGNLSDIMNKFTTENSSMIDSTDMYSEFVKVNNYMRLKYIISYQILLISCIFTA